MACSFPSLGYENFHINMFILCFSSKAESRFEFTLSLLWNLGKTKSNVMKAAFCQWSSLLLSRSLAEFDWHGYWCAFKLWVYDYSAFRKCSPPWILSHSDPVTPMDCKTYFKTQYFYLCSNHLIHVSFVVFVIHTIGILPFKPFLCSICHILWLICPAGWS